MFGITVVARVPHFWQPSLVPRPDFLHIQYWGTRDKVLDHTAANLSQLEAVQDACRDLLLLTRVLLRNQFPQLHHTYLKGSEDERMDNELFAELLLGYSAN